MQGIGRIIAEAEDLRLRRNACCLSCHTSSVEKSYIPTDCYYYPISNVPLRRGAVTQHTRSACRTDVTINGQIVAPAENRSIHPTSREYTQAPAIMLSQSRAVIAAVDIADLHSLSLKGENLVPRAVLDLMDSVTLTLVKGQWRRGLGYVPGEANEGLVSQLEGSPARLPDYDDSAWDECDDLTEAFSQGFTFAWYRITVSVPEEIAGRTSAGMRCVFETCVDDYGEVWIDGECDRERGTVQGFNVPQRIYITDESQPGDTHTIAILAANGPLASPGGTVFVRYASLCFEWGGRPQDEQQDN